MRKWIMLAVACVGCGTVGCTAPWSKSHVGYQLTIYEAPYVEGQTQTIVTAAPGVMGAVPMGNVAGPVVTGQWTHGTGAPPIAAQPIQAGGCGAAAQAGQWASQQSITCEDLCRVLRQVQAQPLPRVQQ